MNPTIGRWDDIRMTNHPHQVSWLSPFVVFHPLPPSLCSSPYPKQTRQDDKRRTTANCKWQGYPATLMTGREKRAHSRLNWVISSFKVGCLFLQLINHMIHISKDSCMIRFSLCRNLPQGNRYRDKVECIRIRIRSTYRYLTIMNQITDQLRF